MDDREAGAPENRKNAIFNPFVTLVIAITHKYAHLEPRLERELYQSGVHDLAKAPLPATVIFAVDNGPSTNKSSIGLPASAAIPAISARIGALPDIFISYRREDTSGYAGRLYDQVSSHFGRDHVFMDVADLEPGSDFVDTIEKKVGTCDALIALIGKNWLSIKDERSQVRLTMPGDFVSIEIAAALKRGIEVIPVLVGGAKMPVQRELPESLQLLSRRQALELSDVHFTRDVGDLIGALKRPGGTRPPQPFTRIKRALAASTICVLAAGIGIWTWHKLSRPGNQTKTAVVSRNSAPQAAVASPAIATKIVDQGNVSGNWKAVVERKAVKYEIYFTFEVASDKLFGTVIYPTGEAGILNGKISQNRISFITKHTPDFADEEATITVEGRVSGDEIEILTQDKDGYSKGVARRVERIGKARVLTP